MIFLPADKCQRFLQIDKCGQFFNWVNVARHVQIAINNKVAISLQYLKKKVSDEVDFLHLDKHESLLQLDTMILMGMVKHS